VLPFLSKVAGSSLTARPKTLSKGVIALGVAGQPDPKHFKKVLGLAAQPCLRILGRAPRPHPRILGLGFFVLFSDLNLFFIQ